MPPYATTLRRLERGNDRHSLHRASTARGAEGAPLDILLIDVSIDGCRMAVTFDVAEGEGIRVGLAGIGSRPAQIIWTRDGEAGCRFDDPLTPEELAETQDARNLVEGRFAALALPSHDPQGDGTVALPLPRPSFLARTAMIVAAAALCWLVPIGAVAAIVRLTAG